MPEVHSRILMMIKAVVQGQIQAMEVMREREFVLKDHEATQTGGVETMIHRRGVYQYPMMIMFITISARGQERRVAKARRGDGE